jgi:hypothetical protein
MAQSAARTTLLCCQNDTLKVYINNLYFTPIYLGPIRPVCNCCALGKSLYKSTITMLMHMLSTVLLPDFGDNATLLCSLILFVVSLCLLATRKQQDYPVNKPTNKKATNIYKTTTNQY